MKVTKEKYEKILKEVSLKNITKRDHDTLPISVFSYSKNCMFDKIWNDETKMCRGLILDDDLNIIARPFSKFFNIEEHQYNVPNEPFSIFDKKDGSLGILFLYKNEVMIATRGSFISDQAKEGMEIFNKKYKDFKPKENLTYLFEIISPITRVVVNYREERELYLLAVIDNETGLDIDFDSIDVPMPKVEKIKACDRNIFKTDDLISLKKDYDGNGEGFVVLFDGGFRVKIKFDEYFRLHKIITGISVKDIAEMIEKGESLQPIIELVPDEFYGWVWQSEKIIRQKIDEIKSDALSFFVDLGDRKANALKYKEYEHPSVLFTILDKKDINRPVWKIFFRNLKNKKYEDITEY